MPYTVRQLAELVNGEVVGDGDLIIQSARTLQDAQPGDISFVENQKHVSRFNDSHARAAIAPVDVAGNGKTLIQVADPLTAFVKVFQHFQGERPERPLGIDSRADVHPSAQVGADATVHAFVQVGEGTIIGQRCRLHPGVIIGRHCRLGDDVVLHPHVVIYNHSVLGNRVHIHANSVIGADGFGYRFQNGKHVKVPQLSNIIIGDDVEMGACTTIDRGVFEPTRIGAGTKIDNHVQIAHNCQIGKHNLFAAFVGIGGSTTTGDYVTLAGQVGVADHVEIGAGAIAGAQSDVINNVPPKSIMFGMPARPAGEQRRIHACQEKLPEMRRDLQRLKKQLGVADEKAA